MPKEDNRRRALTALQESDNLSDAASKAGISRQTLWRYLREPDFAEEYKQQRERKAIREAARLRADYERALQTIIDLINDPDTPPQTKLKACERIIILYNDAESKVDSIAADRLKDAQINQLFG